MTYVPIVNAGEKYINGLRLAFVTGGTTITVSAGKARSNDDINDIIIESAVTINARANGAINRLDTGTLQADTLYAVWAVGDSSQNNTPGAVLSASFTQPTLPAGYDMYRRIGAVLTAATAAPNAVILSFRQVGLSTDRWMWYDAAYATDITNGSSATFAAVNITASVPAIATQVLMKSVFTPTAGDDTLELRPTGSSAASGYAILSGSVAAVVKTGELLVPCNATPGIDYKVTGSATALSVQAYLDLLG